MAHIQVHHVDALARARSARTAQIEALAPFPARTPQYLWEFRRGGFVPLLPVAIGGRAGRLNLGEEIPSAAPGGEPILVEPRAARSPNIGQLAGNVPDQLCYAMTVRGTVPAPNVAAVSTPALPWPAQIVGASLHWNHVNALTLTAGAWGLWATRDAWTNANNTITGESLVQLLEDDVPGAAHSLQQNRLTPIPLRGANRSAETNEMNAAAQLIGGLIREAGMRLTLTLSVNIDGASELVLVVTLRQVGGRAATPIYHARPAPAPRAYTTRAGARAALPPQQPAGRRPIHGFVDQLETMMWTGIHGTAGMTTYQETLRAAGGRAAAGGSSSAVRGAVQERPRMTFIGHTGFPTPGAPGPPIIGPRPLGIR